MSAGGGRFDFDDGGTFCGGWEEGKAHGHGVCTGPNNQGEYCGSWNHGFEVIGCYTWPSGNTYEGHWLQGKRGGLGIETKGRWTYKGEWTCGFKGRYGVRSSTTSRAKYEGTWQNGLQDGYGTETYADGGVYQGQWTGGMRHGYGVRQSVPYGLAAVVNTEMRASSMTSISTDKSLANPDERLSGVDLGHIGARGGFVLSVGPTSSQRDGKNDDSASHFETPKTKKKGVLGGLFKRKKGGSSASSVSGVSRVSSNHSMASKYSAKSGSSYGGSSYYGSEYADQMMDEIDDATQELFYGEWKNDKRNGAGVCERTDGFKYEGDWLNNRRHGYGMTTFKDGTTEEGKYKNNHFIPYKKKKLMVRSKKVREKIDNAIKAAKKAAETARQKAEIAISRTQHAEAKAVQAGESAELARDEAKIARTVAKELAPDYHQPGIGYLRQTRGFNDYDDDQEEISQNQEGEFDEEYQEYQSDEPEEPHPRERNGYGGQSARRNQGGHGQHRSSERGRDHHGGQGGGPMGRGRSQNSLAKSSSGSSMGARHHHQHQRPNSIGRDEFDDGGENQFVTNYEAEMSALKPRETFTLNPIKKDPEMSYVEPVVNQEQAIIPDMHTSCLKQRLIKDDPDDSRLSRGAKIEDYSEKHIPLIPPQDGDWTRYAMFVLLLLLNLGFLVLFTHLS